MKYSLASNKLPKLTCPWCGARKHWQRYLNNETGEALPEEFGRCDNENKCGQWNDPYKIGYNRDKDHVTSISKRPGIIQLPPKATHILKPPLANIPFDVLKQTLHTERYSQNIFIQNLLQSGSWPFDLVDIERVISMYYLGTVTKGYMQGGVTFPFIDINENIRAAQVKLFDETNHGKEIDYLHKIIERSFKNTTLPLWLRDYLQQDKMVSCLFGEHLLSRHPYSPIVLVEAPKTAVYGTLYFGFPNDNSKPLWLAAGAKAYFTLDRVRALSGRHVIVSPDLSESGQTFNQWQNQAHEFEKRLPGTKFVISDLLEKYASCHERKNGLDLADYLIKLDWRSFRSKPQQVIKISTEPTPETAPVP